MLSRAADAIFWLSRYIERAENVARFVDVSQSLSLGFEDALAPQWAPLIYTTGDQAVFMQLCSGGEYKADAFTQENVLWFLMFEQKNPNSILSSLTAARQNARSVRESLTVPMWEEINKFYLFVRDAAERPNPLRRSFEFLDQVKRTSQLVAGVADATLSRGEGWHFYQMGRHLERSDKTSRIVDVKYFTLLPDPAAVGTPLDVVQWSALLESTSALQMYRKRHGRIVPAKVASFLILDREFPRSMLHGLIRAQESLHAITGSPPGIFQHRVEQLMGRLVAEISYMTVEDIITRGMHQFLDSFQTRLNGLGEAIRLSFFRPKQDG